VSDLPISLTDSQFMAVFLIATGGLRAFYSAWFIKKSDPMFKMEPTQSMRYFTLFFGTMISFGTVAFIIQRNSWELFVDGISEWWSIPPIGWIAGACLWFGVISPLFAMLCALHIYRHPSDMAKRVRGGWVATRDIRLHKRPLTVYKREELVAGGTLIKRFVPSGQTT